jgi:hypothetical protein
LEYNLFGIFLILIGGSYIFLYIKNIINNKIKIVSPKIQMNRIKICSNCEHVRLKKTMYKRCSKCGCFLNAKSKLLNQKCPIGKWENGA